MKAKIKTNISSTAISVATIILGISHLHPATALPVQVEEKTAEAYFMAGKMTAHDSLAADAIELYKQAIRLNPNFSEAYYEMGLTRAWSDSDNIKIQKTAIEDLTQAIRLNPTYLAAYSGRGDIKYWMKNYKGAIEDYNYAIGLDPTYAKLYCSRASAYYQQGNKHLALKDYKVAVQLAALDSSSEIDQKRIDKTSKNSTLNHIDAAVKFYQGLAGYFLDGCSDATRNIKLSSRDDFEELAKLNYNLADIHYYLAITNRPYSPEDIGEVLRNLSKAIQLDRDFAEAYLEKGLVLNEFRGSLRESLRNLTQAIKLEPNFAEAFYQRGLLYSRMGYWQSAIADFVEALRISPKPYVENKDVAEDYIKDLQVDAENAEAYYRRGQIRSHLKDYTGAIKDYTKAIQLNPQYSEAYLARGQAHCNTSGPGFYTEADDIKKAISDFTQSIQYSSNSAKAYYNRGYACGSLRFWQQSANNKQNAIADFDKAIQLNPEYGAAYYNRGYAIYDYGCHQGDKSEAVNDFIQAIRVIGKWEFKIKRGIGGEIIDQSDIDKSNRVIQSTAQSFVDYYNRGSVLLRSGDIQGALQDFTKAIQLNPRDSDAYFNRGFARYRLKDYEGAIQDASQAIQLNSENIEAYLVRSLAYLDSKEYQKAIIDSTQAIRIAPDFPEAYMIRGYAQHSLGLILKAIKDYALAFEGWPHRSPCGGGSIVLSSNPSPYYNQGLRFARRGDKKAAITNFQKAARLFIARGNMQRYQETQSLIRQLQQ
jgi:tetratricopeptide (TPR) repeat protein